MLTIQFPLIGIYPIHFRFYFINIHYIINCYINIFTSNILHCSDPIVAWYDELYQYYYIIKKEGEKEVGKGGIMW